MGIKQFFKNFFNKYFYNPHWKCLVCGKEVFEKGQDFCDECKKSLPYNDGPLCAHCGRKVIAFENYCSTCKNVLVDLDMCRSAFSYDYPISKLIKDAKYNRAIYVIDYFAKQLSLVYFQNYFNADYLVYIPMTEKALEKRGYNQSKILAEKLSERINVRVLDCLKKVKDTERQATLGRAERLKNLDGAFRVVDKKLVENKSILIVDDVSTTGATAQAVASRLKKAGAKIVNLITVASTPPIDKY